MESARRQLFREKIKECADPNKDQNHGGKRKRRSTPRKSVLLPKTKNISDLKKIDDNVEKLKKPKIKIDNFLIEIEEINRGDDIYKNTFSEKTTSNKSEVNQMITDYSSTNQNISPELCPDDTVSENTTSNKSGVNQMIIDYSSINSNIRAELCPEDTFSENTTSNKSGVNQMIVDYSSVNENISAELFPDDSSTQAIIDKEKTTDYINESAKMSDQQRSILQPDENSTGEFIDVENITDQSNTATKDDDPLEQSIQEFMTENEIEIIRKSLDSESAESTSNNLLVNDSEPGTSYGREKDTSSVTTDKTYQCFSIRDDKGIGDNALTTNNNSYMSNILEEEITEEKGENKRCENEEIINDSNLEDHEAILDRNDRCENTSVSKKCSKPKRKVKLSKSYVDFLSDSEDFEWDSTSWKDSETVSSDDDQEPKKKKRKSLRRNLTNESEEKNVEETVGERGFKKKKQNKQKIRKQAKDSGEEYVTKKGKIVKRKTIKPNPCVGKKCGNNCGDITEEKRKRLFDHFYSLSLQRKKDWLVSLTRKTDIKRKRSKDSGVRCTTYEYFINDGEGKRQVCAQFLQNTLDITHKYIYYTLTNASLGSAKEDLRGKVTPANKIDDNTKSGVTSFIKSLPALPSHYCRKDTEKVYLPVEFKNIKNLYRIYKEEKTSKQEKIVGEKTFRNIFNGEFNIGFHIPKKDKCVKCIRFEVDKSEEAIEAKREHLEEKKASKDRHECHRDVAKQNPSILCASFDLQKVLNTPYGKDLVLFYSRKYAVYNLCFYESGTRQGFCYIWGESEGKRGANEIATILERYILQVDARGSIKHLILYSDSCPGQNKNRTIMAVVHHTLTQCKNLDSIQLNYLLPGHTEMPVDSMHSTIEGSVKNTTIWAPSQWVTVCQMARKELAPYNVSWLDHTNFKGYDEFADKYFKGNLTGKISKIKVATFKKSTLHKMTVRYSMKTDAEEESIAVATSSGKGNKKINDKLYKNSLPISKPKYNDLKKLCDNDTIPRIFQAEYKNLQYGNVKDHLVDTDLEDETDEE